MPAVLSEKKQTARVVLLSVAVPVLVAFLLFSPSKLAVAGRWVYFLPGLHAAVNGTTAGVLVYAVWAVKRGKTGRHKKAMVAALVLGALFLASYVVYHSSVPSAKFGGEGALRAVYFSVLISHIALSMVALPAVLAAYLFAWAGKVKRHREIVRLAFPLWLYVSLSGVAVYCLVRPYYPF